MRFIELDSGKVYSVPDKYTFWFDGQQSTNMIYIKKLCILHNKQELVARFDTNSIFKFVDVNNLLNNPNNFYDNTVFSITSKGTKYDSLYIHILYITVQSNNEGEIVDDMNIDGIDYKIGADFYMEDETLQINLQNFGVELPKTIQKSLYPANIHEDNIDNILLNRKLKELISNYWDVIANRGSYKSLINSLKWFEWGDEVQMREMWKHTLTDKPIYSERDLNSILEDLYEENMINFSKTTYITLNHCLQKLDSTYDIEGNPDLKWNISKWSNEDISLKMSLLGHFFKEFFMPIHMDLMFSTIESIIFTNTYKLYNRGRVDRIDEIYNFEYISSSTDGQTYLLGNVSSQVGPDTVLGIKMTPSKYEDIYFYTFGVDTENVKGIVLEEDVETFGSQYYKGVGVIVPVTLNIPLKNNDFIKRITVSMEVAPNIWKTHTFNDKIFGNNNSLEYNFKLLCTEEREYDIRMQFDSGSGKTLTKKLKFNVIDPDNVDIKIYRLLHKWNPNLDNFFNDKILNDYMFLRQPMKGSPESYIQYLPISKDGGGLRTNHLLVFKGDYKTDAWINKNYYTIHKVAKWSDLSINPEEVGEDGDIETLYTICISKKFNFNPRSWLDSYKTDEMYKNEYTFIPQFHDIQEITGDTLADFMIGNDIPIFVKPEIKFGKFIDKYEWEFENASTLKKIHLPSIQEPFIAGVEGDLTPGYYNIIFRYSLVDGTSHEIKLNSAFYRK